MPDIQLRKGNHIVIYNYVRVFTKTQGTVYVRNMGIMDNTSTVKLVQKAMSAFAEFERDTIVERTGVIILCSR